MDGEGWENVSSGGGGETELGRQGEVGTQSGVFEVVIA